MNTTDAVQDGPNYRYYEHRLRTFDTWPKQMIPNKYDLAQQGFVYTGQSDKVTCFQCGVVLKDWERTDDPWIEHSKWSPHCDYLKMIGCDRGQNVTDKHNFVKQWSDVNLDVRCNRV